MAEASLWIEHRRPIALKPASADTLHRFTYADNAGVLGQSRSKVEHALGEASRRLDACGLHTHEVAVEANASLR